MSFWGSLGKGALKVAKYAAPVALAATGVGAPFAAMAAGGLNALDKKVSGGSWKDAALAGGIGAGTSMIPGIGSAVGKGISPTLGGIAKGTFGSIGNDVGIATDIMSGMQPQAQNAAIKAPQAINGAGYTQNVGMPAPGLGYGGRDLAQIMQMGGREARINQPFRYGSSMAPLAGSPEGTPNIQLPPIYSLQGRGQRRFRPEQANG